MREPAQLVLACPILEIARTIACALIAEGKDKLRSCEDLAGLELIDGCIAIDARENPERTHIVNFESIAPVACPSDSAHQHFALILADTISYADFKERMAMHCCTRAELGVNNLLAEL